MKVIKGRQRQIEKGMIDLIAVGVEQLHLIDVGRIVQRRTVTAWPPKLRPGNVHSADGWDEVLLPVIDGYRAQGQTVVVRADAAFALPALLISGSNVSRALLKQVDLKCEDDT